MIAFGPVPSRRLGRSLGINNIPPKVCTYSCVYCQLGKTIKMQFERRKFFKPEEIVKEVEDKVEKAKEKNESIDYLTFVPDGEPTLDINLGKEIDLLKLWGIKIAVISNASLIWQRDVRNDLLKADLISLKIDSVDEDTWNKVNRPVKALRLEAILQGALELHNNFKGELVTETMLIQNINDDEEEIRRIADYLAELRPDIAYISIPTRPPTEKWAKPTRKEIINSAFQLFAKKIGYDRVEYLIGYEGNAFAFSGNIEEDLLSITSVHPMREEGVKELLKKADADWNIVENLLKEEKLIELEYENHRYYMRKLPSRIMH